jgi:hypothetical protein
VSRLDLKRQSVQHERTREGRQDSAAAALDDHIVNLNLALA